MCDVIGISSRLNKKPADVGFDETWSYQAGKMILT